MIVVAGLSRRRRRRRGAASSGPARVRDRVEAPVAGDGRRTPPSGGSREPRRSEPPLRPQTSSATDRAVRQNASLTLSTTPDEVEGVTDRAIRDRRRARRLRPDLARSTRRHTQRERHADAEDPVGAKLDDGLAQHLQARARQLALAADPGRHRPARGARGRRCATRAPTATGLRVRLAKATTDKERSRLRAPARPRVAAASRSAQRAGQRARPPRSPTPRSSSTIDGDRRSGAAAAPGRPLDAGRRARRRACACSR